MIIQLEPLTEAHRPDLYLAGQDEQLWAYCPSGGTGDHFHRWFDKALNTEKQQSFAVRRVMDQKLVGSTRYYNIEMEQCVLRIGYTWYIQEVWGTAVNTTCKYLLLQDAFENREMNRIEFTVDARNARSIAAVKKLGATQEGILRQHRILQNGFVRDTVMLSIIKSEWPAIKSELEQRMRDFTPANPASQTL